MSTVIEFAARRAGKMTEREKVRVAMFYFSGVDGNKAITNLKHSMAFDLQTIARDVREFELLMLELNLPPRTELTVGVFS